MIWLQWATEVVEGLQEANTVKEETGEDRSNPSDGKVSLAEKEVPSIWE